MRSNEAEIQPIPCAHTTIGDNTFAEFGSSGTATPKAHKRVSYMRRSVFKEALWATMKHADKNRTCEVLNLPSDGSNEAMTVSARENLLNVRNVLLRGCRTLAQDDFISCYLLQRVSANQVVGTEQNAKAAAQLYLSSGY